MSCNDECSHDTDNLGSCGDETRTHKGERPRTVDSPLGHLDPSRITHMVVDQVGLGGAGVTSDSDGFVVPGPPHQQWLRSSPIASPTIIQSPSRVMDGCGQMQSRIGTPTNVHMQQGSVSSPSICGGQMTPQQMVHQQQGLIQSHPTGTGLFDQSGIYTAQQQQLQSGFSQSVPESPGAMHIQQQIVMSENPGVQDDVSPGMTMW
ncbi:hypothetical protein DICVIV_08191 [Dictyocaulus viviparus]|uniref:Uncharacterized protein n=1 Tax=Dictyocaulus viviparus TaxID=29172 RepID=A0A0D8XTR6_DICVI|nr:hypothetical protein DICVIV_08191 [Dictyocaulus viviparus]